MTTNSLRNIRILLCLFFCFRMTPFIYAGEFLFTTINASQGLSDNQIRYIPSRQLYFIDGFRRPNEGTSEKNRYFYLWFDMDNRTFEQTFCDLDDANFLYSEHLEQVLYFTEEGNLAFRILPLNIELPIKHQQGCLDIQLSHNNKMIALYQDNNLKLCTFPNMEILAELSNIGYGNISFSPDDKEILIASTIKGLIYKLEKCS